MRALDGGALLGLLEGDPSLRPVLKELRGHEVATTEISLLEVAGHLREGPARGRAGRQVALERLRRKLTVLPIDGRAATEVARRMGAQPKRPDLVRLLEWGALEAYGCEVLYSRSSSPPAGSWRCKVVKLSARKA